jgi:hypothetical protein
MMRASICAASRSTYPSLDPLHDDRTPVQRDQHGESLAFLKSWQTTWPILEVARVGWQTQASTNDCSASFLPYFVLLSHIIDTQAISPAYIPVGDHIIPVTSLPPPHHVDHANSKPRAHVPGSRMPSSRLSPERLSPILSEPPHVR